MACVGVCARVVREVGAVSVCAVLCCACAYAVAERRRRRRRVWQREYIEHVAVAVRQQDLERVIQATVNRRAATAAALTLIQCKLLSQH